MHHHFVEEKMNYSETSKFFISRPLVGYYYYKVSKIEFSWVLGKGTIILRESVEPFARIYPSLLSVDEFLQYTISGVGFKLQIKVIMWSFSKFND